jgi:hypothetical protein
MVHRDQPALGGWPFPSQRRQGKEVWGVCEDFEFGDAADEAARVSLKAPTSSEESAEENRRQDFRREGILGEGGEAGKG